MRSNLECGLVVGSLLTPFVVSRVGDSVIFEVASSLKREFQFEPQLGSNCDARLWVLNFELVFDVCLGSLLGLKLEFEAWLEFGFEVTLEP